MADVTASFQYLYSSTAPSSMYMVEDLHTAYWDEFGGGVVREGSFIEVCKSLIDQLNADHARNQVSATDFTKSTLSMHFDDSVVVFSAGAHLKKHAPQICRPLTLENSIVGPV